MKHLLSPFSVGDLFPCLPIYDAELINFKFYVNSYSVRERKGQEIKTLPFHSRTHFITTTQEE